MLFDKYLKQLGIKATYGVNEKAPKFVYDALKQGEHFLFLRRDRKPWNVVISLEMLEKLINEKNNRSD